MSRNVSINLNLGNSLENDSSNKLRVKSSLRTGNTLTVESDGLYAQAIPGKPGSTGTGYPDGYTSLQTGIKTGEATPFSTDPAPRRIVAPAVVHRIYTASSPDGSDINNFRTIDRLYPGDMYRVRDNTHNQWNYYIITRTDGFNVTAHTGEIACVPFNKTDVN